MPEEDKVDWGRRNFLKAMAVISAGVATAGVLQGVVRNVISPQVGLASFPTMQLLGTDGKPIKYSDIPVNSTKIWLYDYPLTDDPNFLLSLGKPDNTPMSISSTEVTIPATGATFKSPGGVGPTGQESVVSYSAICQHLGCVPPIIRFYPPGNSVPGTPFSGSSNPGYIHCSCHGSTYDPFKGAGVITGPTTHPLPSVYLKYNSDGTFSAYNMIGPTIYGRVSDLSGGTPFPSNQKTTGITILA